MNEDEITEQAHTQLATVCPIVSSLLAFDDRLADEVRYELARRDRPALPHAWGMQFAARLSTDPDPWIAWAAAVDAGALAAAEAQQADPPCPGDPLRAVMLIASGTDPRCD